MRSIYQQDSPEAAWGKSSRSSSREWVGRYPEIAAKWEKDWCELSPFFDHPDAIRRVIYTTNPVEALQPHSSQGHQDQGCVHQRKCLGEAIIFDT
ncbi:MAG: transposase [Flavobacteriales bacterium]|nr:transposase [Flavobacteriales bacterium]